LNDKNVWIVEKSSLIELQQEINRLISNANAGSEINIVEIEILQSKCKELFRAALDNSDSQIFTLLAKIFSVLQEFSNERPWALELLEEDKDELTNLIEKLN
jgi:hypothetical protein